MPVKFTCYLCSPPSFFQDGLKTADKLKQYIEKLAADLYNVKLLFALVSSPAHYRVSFFIEKKLLSYPKSLSPAFLDKTKKYLYNEQTKLFSLHFNYTLHIYIYIKQM